MAGWPSMVYTDWVGQYWGLLSNLSTDNNATPWQKNTEWQQGLAKIPNQGRSRPTSSGSTWCKNSIWLLGKVSSDLMVGDLDYASGVVRSFWWWFGCNTCCNEDVPEVAKIFWIPLYTFAFFFCGSGDRWYILTTSVLSERYSVLDIM
jgi:hypothetical protein